MILLWVVFKNTNDRIYMQQFYKVLYTSITFQCSVISIEPFSGYGYNSF